MTTLMASQPPTSAVPLRNFLTLDELGPHGLRSVLDPAITAHIVSLFDLQIASGLDAVVALSKSVGSNAKAVRFQISGHVEDDGTGFVNVHVWPTE